MALTLHTCCAVYPTVEQNNRLHASSYIWAFPIAFAYFEKDISAVYARDHVVPHAVQDYLTATLHDIEQGHPAMIYVSKGHCVYCPPHFEMLAYLEARGVIAEITERGYHVAEDTAFYRIYIPRQNGT